MRISVLCVLLSLPSLLPALSVEEFRALPDDREAVRSSYGLRRVAVLSPERIEVEVGHSASPAVENPKAWRILSEDDPAYAYERFSTPVRATVRKETEVEAPDGCAIPRFERRFVVLDLPAPLQEGRRYHAVAQGVESAVAVGGTSSAAFALGVQPADDPQLDRTVLGLRRIEPVGNGVIMLAFGPCFAPAAGTRPESYTVTVDGRPARVLNTGRLTRVDCYQPVGWPFAVIPAHEVYLRLDRQLADGARIAVVAAPAVTRAQAAATLVFASATTPSNSLKVNQVGYLAASPVKIAYLGRWLGSYPEITAGAADAGQARDAFWAELATSTSQTQAGAAAPTAPAAAPAAAAPVLGPALAFDAPPRFHLLPAGGGAAVFSGEAVLVHRSGEPDGGVLKVDHSGENVYTLDFTAFRTPGRYVVSVPGVGCSLPFAIGDDVYRTAFETQARGLFAQRCGIALEPPFSEWRRISCHDHGLIATDQPVWRKPYDLPGRTLYREAAAAPEADRLALDQDAALVARYLFDGGFAAVEGRGPALDPCGAPRFGQLDRKLLRAGGSYGPTADGAGNGARGRIRLDTTRGATVCCWFRKEGRIKFGGAFFRLGEQPGARLALEAGWGVPSLSAHQGQGHGDVARMGRPTDGRWHHLAAVLDPADAKPRRLALYDNGVEVAGGMVQAMDPVIDGPLLVGALDGEEAGGASFADLRLYARTLAPAELRLLARPDPLDAPVVIHASGGHHDAGDYNPRSHIVVAQRLMEAYELAPRKFTDGQLPIPERGNGIPDILDEAAWAMRLWLGLQDEDGGVRHGTESDGDPNFVQTVELDPKGDYAFAKDAEGSMIFAGVMAQASRIWKSLGREAEAADFLRRARAAYAWAQAHPTPGIDKAYYGMHVAPSRAYAAAQLLRTTGERSFDADFQAEAVWSRKEDADVEDYGRYNMADAAQAYALCPDGLADETMRGRVRRAIIAKADAFIRYCTPQAYAFVRHPWAPITWGTGAYHNWLGQVHVAYRLTGDAAYLAWMVRTSDNALGANPLNLSWITGLGSRTIRAPLHSSLYGATGRAAPGLQCQGPNQKGDGYRILETFFPKVRDSFAVLYTYSDVRFNVVMNEGTTPNMVNSLAAFGLLLPDR